RPLSRGPCMGNTVRVQGRPLPSGTIPPLVNFNAVASGYFETMGIRLVRGRFLDQGDVDRRDAVVAIDQVFADRVFPNTNPIGEHIASNRPPARPGAEPDFAWLTIVGVVAKTAGYP